MKPKLIVINGPLGSGKTTLANKYAENHPVTLCLDIDTVWAMISNWREEKTVTSELSKDMAVEMARIALRSSHDVVIPQILQSTELRERLVLLADECEANYVEILLDVEKEEAILRFKTRNIRNGHASGFREGGIIATSGREKKLAKMHEAMMRAASAYEDIQRMKPIFDDIETTYRIMIEALAKAESDTK